MRHSPLRCCVRRRRQHASHTNATSSSECWDERGPWWQPQPPSLESLLLPVLEVVADAVSVALEAPASVPPVASRDPPALVPSPAAPLVPPVPPAWPAAPPVPPAPPVPDSPAST